jgi:ADP-ribose pyrophosphatase
MMTATVNYRQHRHTGRVFTLETENVTLDNGVTIDIDVVRHPGASAIVPLTGTGEVMMIEQYRHAVGGYIWEIPAGTLDPGETPLTCAKRELIEEAGVSAAEWRKLGEITPVPGYSDERIHIFLAAGLSPAEQHLDADEVLRVHEIPLEDAMAMIGRGEIQDAKTLCGLLMTARHRASEP